MLKADWSRRAPMVLTLTLLLPAGMARAAEFVPPAIAPQVHYDVDLELDPAANTLAGRALARVRNTGGAPLPSIHLEWTDPQSAPVLVGVAGAAPVEHAGAPGGIVVELTSAIPPGGEAQIELRFSRAAGSLDNGWGGTDWLPRLTWGYETHASYDVAIDAPSDVAVATSARQDPITKRYRADGVRDFGVYFARGFLEKEVQAGSTLVRSLFRPGMQECADLVLETAADAVNYYRERLGFFPQPSLTILPGGPRPWGGYPFATAMVAVHGLQACGEADRDSHWRWIAAHEVGHQYWLEHVLAKDPEQGYGWLMIGLGIWTDREYMTARGLEGQHARLLKGYADAVRAGKRTTIEISPEDLRTLDFDYNSIVTHGKGFAVISALEQVVSPPTFDRVVRKALTEYGGRRLGTPEFRNMLEQESGQELGWLLLPLLRSNRYAAYEASAPEPLPDGSGFSVRVTSVGTLRLPLPLEVVFEDGTRTRRLIDRRLEEQEVEFPNAQSAIEEVALDPDGVFPLVTPAPRLTEEVLAFLAEDMPWTDAGSAPARLFRSATDIDSRNDAVWRKLGLTLFDSGIYAEAFQAFQRVYELEQDEASSWRFGALAWMGLLSDVLQQRDKAVDFYRRALDADSGHVLQHDQFGLVLNRDWVQQRLTDPFVWPRR